MSQNKTFIITGMHRSGTSLVASLLKSSGVHIGNNLLGSNESNLLGHYEDVDFLNFHQDMLGEENRDGFKLTPDINITERHIQTAKQLIEQKDKQLLWGWKDPRTVLFLEFWKEFIPSSNSILVYRHPIEVIVSLIRRSTDFELIAKPQKTIALWHYYNKKVLEYKKANPLECVLCNLSGITHNINDFLKLVSLKTNTKLNIEKNTNVQYQPSRLKQYHWPKSIEEVIVPILNESLDLYIEMESIADLPAKTENLKTLNAPLKSLANIINNDTEDEVLGSLSYLAANIVSPSLTNKFFQSADTLAAAQQNELNKRKKIIAEHIELVHEKQKQLTGVETENKVLSEQALKLTSVQQEKKKLSELLSQLNIKHDKLNQDIINIKAENQELTKKNNLYHEELQVSKHVSIEQDKKIEGLKNKLIVDQNRIKKHQGTISELEASVLKYKNECEFYRDENSRQKTAAESNQKLLKTSTEELEYQSLLIEDYEKRLLLARAPRNGVLVKTFKIATALISRIFGAYKPHPLFDAHWYKTNNPRSRFIHTFPFIHYSLFGWKEGRDPSPFFNTRWYLTQNPDVLDKDKEPLEHYVKNGWKEGRDPSPKFSTAKYLSYFPDLVTEQINPLIHFVSNLSDSEFSLALYSPDKVKRKEITRPAAPKSEQRSISNTEESLRQENIYFEDEITPLYKKLPVRLIAFYLPQFHPIPENDLFWGEGFTEWRNVTKARPQFKGHTQPKLPGSLGFYDLRVPEVMKTQARLAKQYGIEGFCFHFYWFNGRRVLEKPIEQLLANPEIDIQFCINWANENWTRSWDGKEREVLIEQNHTAQDDIDFINEVKRFFDDPRYIKVDSKPVLMLYNPTLLPNASATAKRWRQRCKELGFEIFLLVAETHGFDSQSETWFDGLVEFPPLRKLPEDATHKYELLDSFHGNVFDYADLASIHSTEQQVNFPVFKTVSPSWDNTARRNDKATIFAGSTPTLYQDWLTKAVNSTIVKQNDKQRLVFVNAWNEWAEGAYLEPDAQYGYAYLNATARTLKKFDTDQATLIFTSHDANLGGAQNLILTLLQWLRSHTDLNIKIVCASNGVQKSRFESLYPTFIVDNDDHRAKHKVREELLRFCGDNVSAIFMNSVVSASLLDYLKPVDAPRILYAHELENSIEKFYGREKLSQSIHLFDAIIGGSQPVIDNLVASYSIDKSITSVLESFIVSSERKASSSQEHESAKQKVMDELGLDSKTKIVLGCGMIEWRKGPDLFVDVAKKLARSGVNNVSFVWIGPIPKGKSIVDDYLNGLEGFVKFIGEKTNFKPYFDAADVFLLPSREDPFPLVCLEAADSELPIITFTDNGGTPKFITTAKCGYTVPFEDTTAMADKLNLLVNDGKLKNELGKLGHNAVLNHYSDKSAGPKVLEKIRSICSLKPKVSIIVPAYNHGRFLRKRLDSIYKQSFQDFEVILLDDASNDETCTVLNEYKDNANTRICINEHNQGSPFKQWAKGISMSNADIIWIAEDDDYCEHNFLKEMLPLFEDPDVSLAYSQSTAVDEDNNIMFSYMDYYKHEFNDYKRWLHQYKNSGQEEITHGLSLVNTIPNASAVVFRKFDTRQWQEQWATSVLAGDWAFYLHALQQGKIAYLPSHLNYHRRHDQTMTRKTQNAATRFKEVSEVHKDVLKLYQVDKNTKDKMKDKMRSIWKDVSSDSSKKKFNDAYNDIINS